MNGGTVLSTANWAIPASWKVAGIGDFKLGDGRSDILWRNDDGANAEWQMNGSTLLANTSWVSRVSWRGGDRRLQRRWPLRHRNAQ